MRECLEYALKKDPKIFGKNTERNVKMLKSRFGLYSGSFSPHSYAVIGDIYGVSHECGRRAVKKMLRTFRDLRKKGFLDSEDPYYFEDE